MLSASEAQKYLEKFIRREKAMRERVLRGPDKLDKIASCDMALEAVSVLAQSEPVRETMSMFGEEA